MFLCNQPTASIIVKSLIIHVTLPVHLVGSLVDFILALQGRLYRHPPVTMSSRYITLYNDEGYEFVVSRDAAQISSFLRPMISGDSNFQETATNRIPLQDMAPELAEKVCEYFHYHLKNKDKVGDIPEFDIPPEMALELLVAADYLDT